MGRKRKTGKGLPTRVYYRHGAYHYVRPRDEKWIRLGKTLPEMHRNLADVIEDVPNKRLLSGVFDRYRREIIPQKATKTQRENLRALEKLEPVFGKARPGDVRPADIYGYLDARTAKIAANREIALLQHVFRKARQWGLCDSNPCIGVERNRERPSDAYVTDEQFKAAYKAAPPMVRYAMALAYLTGQRQADILKLRRADLLEQGVYFRQRKTGREVIVEYTPALRKTLRRAQTHGGAIAFDYLIRARRGSAFSSSGFQTAWKRLMAKLPEAYRFQFRDIRAKARSDGDDKRLLGHANPQAMERIYQRKPVNVRPVR